MSELIDISLPIYNNMWAYRPEWKNSVELIESTVKGGVSTVYKSTLFSNTGTYIETTSHKLPSEIMLSEFPLEAFHRKVKVIVCKDTEVITKNDVISTGEKFNIIPEKSDALIISSGYGINYRKENYISSSPSFDPDLTDWLSGIGLDLLGVDTPVIENSASPYQPVIKLFNANPGMLLLAPLLIDTTKIFSGVYTLSCFPLKVESTSVMLCRPILIKDNE